DDGDRVDAIEPGRFERVMLERMPITRNLTDAPGGRQRYYDSGHHSRTNDAEGEDHAAYVSPQGGHQRVGNVTHAAQTRGSVRFADRGRGGNQYGRHDGLCNHRTQGGIPLRMPV